MNSNIFRRCKMRRKLLVSIGFIAPWCLLIVSCAPARNVKEKTKTLAVGQESGESIGSNGDMGSTYFVDLDFDEHSKIVLKPESTMPSMPNLNDSLIQTFKLNPDTQISLPDDPKNEFEITNSLENKNTVANRIVENYLDSNNREPGGHCLAVSKKRFEKAYKDVHGHSVYEDLPDSMATKYYSPREVFDYLYVSASGTHAGWRSLPEKYRGKGAAGAIAYAGMGTLVDWFGIWSGELKPGAMMQVWKHSNDYEQVVHGVDKKDFDPFGHSFIFMGYVRDEKNKIIGIRIADQGYQSYRPLVPNDYEIWWAVNLSI